MTQFDLSTHEQTTIEFKLRRAFLRSAVGASALLALGSFSRIAAAALQDSGALTRGRPSATAQGAALLRAAHQLLDDPKVFVDPLAVKMLGAEAALALSLDPQRFARSRSLRAFVALRSRYAEDRLGASVARGIEQYVVLGAGLDTFAYRNPYPRLNVFEVDHPATQVWKQKRLEQAGIATPDSLTFVPVDFEIQTLADRLRASGMREDEPAFFSLLGVAVYITKPALMDTLRFVASSAPGSEIVFCYSVPSGMLSETQREARAAAAERVAAIGEPWISYYEPAALTAELEELGFSELRDLGSAEANERYFQHRTDGLRVTGSGRVMMARV
jgi:methyltransferase (TIGR00027 family)